MKGISAVVATLLMLIITIGLAGLAYSYISGVFTARTAVILSVDAASYCNQTNIVAYVRNDGTSPSQQVSVIAFNSTGVQIGSCSISSINSGDLGSCAIARQSGSPPDTIRVVASTRGASTQGTVYCAVPAS